MWRQNTLFIYFKNNINIRSCLQIFLNWRILRILFKIALHNSVQSKLDDRASWDQWMRLIFCLKYNQSISILHYAFSIRDYCCYHIIVGITPHTDRALCYFISVIIGPEKHGSVKQNRFGLILSPLVLYWMTNKDPYGLNKNNRVTRPNCQCENEPSKIFEAQVSL